MGIFSRFRKTENYNLKKSDFTTEKEESEVEVTFISDEFAKSLAEYKKKQGIPERENDSKKFTSVTRFANITLFGNKIRIQYDPTEIEIDENIFINQINEKLNWISENEIMIYRGITDKLLILKNEDWVEENAETLSDKQFIKCLTLTSILFFHDGSSQLGFDDGNLFWGHSIMVDLSKDNKFIDAELLG
ncbi:DUF2262 domain-containing protein [Winogradskyella flava]|uniref:DUF2262 domain-containing protein n=1 Tax=Winogradskyella flava TaxID=1884876 RepID=UPI00249173CA|nr:DUF2262 domain-containing protein [Winogradskyella flava]